ASNMIRAIKAVSTERGRDPRAFALFAFGGNGPLFAAGMAAALGIKRIVVPPAAGLVSSFGLLYANVEHHYARTSRPLFRQSDPAEIGHAWDALAHQALDQLAVEGFSGARAQIKRSAALHYKGQTYELVVPAPDAPVDARFIAALEEAFGVEHERTYGHRAGPEEPVELVAIQVVGTAALEASAGPGRAGCRGGGCWGGGKRRRNHRAAPTSAPTTDGSTRRCCAAPTSEARASGRSSSRNTTPPAWCRPARERNSTRAGISWWSSREE